MSLLEDQERIYLFYIGVAMGAFLLVTGLMQLLSRGESHGEARNRRMRMIAKGATAEEVLALLKPNVDVNWTARLPMIGNLARDMRQAGLRMAPSRLLLLSALSFVALSALGTAFLAPLQASLLGAVIALLGPVAVVKSMRQKRLDRITAQLPDALDLMARGLKVGHPLNTSIGSVARDMPDPIGTEFGLIFDQVSYGDDLVSAVQEFADRVDAEDVQCLAASIAIQHGTGGDLARVIEILAKVIRGRMAMRRRIQAISSEGRLTGYFLSALPVAIFILTSLGTPGYYLEISNDPLFRPMVIAVLFFVVANALILRKMVNFRI